MNDKMIYLDSCILQQDMRIRMPKTVLVNLELEKGKSFFDVYLNKEEGTVVLKVKKPDDPNDQEG